MNALQFVLLILLIAGCSSVADTKSKPKTSPLALTATHSFKLEEIVDRDSVIWGFDFLPDNRIIYTERDGAMLIYNPATSQSQSLQGVPAVAIIGQGGLLDVRVHPQFSSNQLIYFTYSETVGGAYTTAVARAKLSGTQLTQLQKLKSIHEASGANIHFGSRIEFDGQGHIYVSVGDRNDRDRAQDLSFHNGKILRLNEDGSVPNNNPFVNQASAKPEIWSYGHRNPQGLAMDPITGLLWQAEFGPQGGDELNLVKPGHNYGWPVITYGAEYGSGAAIGEGTSKPGMEQPIAFWVPSISPSGIGFYTGNKFPNWRGNIFMANLSAQHLRRLVIRGTSVVHQEELMKDSGTRFRHVRQSRDGFLYFSTDDGRLMKMVPDGSG